MQTALGKLEPLDGATSNYKAKSRTYIFRTYDSFQELKTLGPPLLRPTSLPNLTPADPREFRYTNRLGHTPLVFDKITSMFLPGCILPCSHMLLNRMITMQDIYLIRLLLNLFLT
jgi:hypothetical protein